MSSGKVTWAIGLKPDRTFDFSAELFIVEAPPHIMIRLKALFPRVDKAELNRVKIRATPEACRDLEWFALRYPLTFDQAAADAIAEGSRQHQATTARIAGILDPAYVPRAFPLSKPLRHYQSVALEAHLTQGALLLADQVGLGKTPTAIGSFTDPRTLPALVVCLSHLCRQWQAMLAEFLPFASSHIIRKKDPYPLPPADVYIISYPKLSGWAAHFVSENKLRSIVFDEIQELRHEDTGKYTAAETLCSAVAFRLGLSATPIFNYGGEIFNVVNLLLPGRLGSREEFHREWCRGGGGKWLLNDPEAFGRYLRDEAYMIRRTREDVGMELPPVERVSQLIPHDQQKIDDISDVATKLAHLVLEGSFHESGEAARLLDMKLREATGVAKAPFVAEFVRMLVEDGQQVLLFGWHREVYEIWLEQLKDLTPRLYTGSESPGQKFAAQQDFETGACKVLIMSLRSGAGVDGIQKASNTVVFGELDWSPGVHEQCIGRLNRDDNVGGNVTAFFLVSDAGSDPAVAEILQLKTAQSTHLLDPGKVPTLATLQTATDRLKRLAKNYLSHRKATVAS